ncbi:hypothetical protein BIW58_25300, partial [Salmonella enterica]|nr:hypothetical protein [Salmonella enterica]
MLTLNDVVTDKKNGVTLPFYYFFHVIKGNVTFVINGADISLKENQGLFVGKSVCLDIKFNEMDEQPATISTIRITSEIISKFNYLNYIRSGFDINGVNGIRHKRNDYCLFDFNHYSSSEKQVLLSLTTSIEKSNT